MSNQEKTAWLTLTINTLIMCSSILLFVFLREQLGTSRAILVSMSPISFFVLTAFVPLIFLHTQKGNITVTSQDGKTIRFPYRRFLITGIVIGFLNGTLIVTMILSKSGIVFPGLFAMLSVTSIITISSLVIILARLYVMKQHASAINMNKVNTTDIFFYGSDLDERDLAIRKAARWRGYGFFLAVYICGILGLWVWAQTQGQTSITIDCITLPMFIFSAMILILIVDSMATISLHRQGGE